MVKDRKSVLSIKVTAAMRRTVELLSAHLTVKSGTRHTLTDVIEEAIRTLAKREKV